MSITEAIDVLTQLGVLPVIGVVASVGVAVFLYHRFRR